MTWSGASAARKPVLVSALRRPTIVARKWTLPFMLAAYPSWDRY